MSIDGLSSSETRLNGRVSFFHRAYQWVWRLGESDSPFPVYWITVAVLLSVQLSRTIHDVDIFWQLKLGEITLTTGLPATEPFLAGKDNEPLAVVAWLGQAVFAAVRLIGGWDLLRLFDAIAWLGGFVAVGWSLARRLRNHWFAVLALWVGWFAVVPFASIRPQTFALLCFGLLVVLVRSNQTDRAKVMLGAVLLIFWQNLHPSVAVAAAYLAASAVGEWGAYLFRRGPQPGFARIVLVPIAGIATLATPAGFDIYRIAADNRDRCVWDQLRITEWLPIWEEFPSYGRANATPILLATVAILFVRGRRVAITDLLPLLALTVMTCLTFRFVLFWGIAVIPVWVQCLTAFTDPPRLGPQRRNVRRAIAAAAMLVALLPLRVWPLNFLNYLPFAGIAALQAEHVRGPVYCNYLWGGIITDFGYPDWRPTHDGRYYLFTRAELAAHFAASRGEVPLAELEERFRPVAFFVRPGYDDGLIARLRIAPQWREVFADRDSVVFIGQ
jgi:hypothetical protein